MISDTSSKASQFLSAIINSKFIISLNTAGDLFFLTLSLRKVLQDINYELFEACKHVENISDLQ